MARPFLSHFAPSPGALARLLLRPVEPTEADKDRAQDRRVYDGVRDMHAARASAQEALARKTTKPWGCGVEASTIHPPKENT